MGSQTETQWRYVAEDGYADGEPVREVGPWESRGAASTAGTAEEASAIEEGVPYDRVYLEKRSVTYGEPVRVELDDEGSCGDVRGDE